MNKTREKSLSSIHQQIRLSIMQTVHLSTHHHLLQTCRKSPVIMGRKLPARKPSKITYHQYIVCYAFWCTCLRIVHTCTWSDRSVVTPVCASSIQAVHKSCATSAIAPIHVSSIQPICTSCITSAFAPVCASPVLSIHPYNDECLEFPDGFLGTKYEEKNLSEITVKFPHDVTVTLQQVKFPEETPETTMRVIYPGNFMLT